MAILQCVAQIRLPQSRSFRSLLQITSLRARIVPERTSYSTGAPLPYPGRSGAPGRIRAVQIRQKSIRWLVSIDNYTFNLYHWLQLHSYVFRLEPRKSPGTQSGMWDKAFSSIRVNIRKCVCEIFEPSIEMHIFASLRHALVPCQKILVRDPVSTGCILLAPNHTNNLTSWPERDSRHKTLKSLTLTRCLPTTLTSTESAERIWELAFPVRISNNCRKNGQN
jgi:hypothetical protein